MSDRFSQTTAGSPNSGGIIYRSGTGGSPLSHDEVDGNFAYLLAGLNELDDDIALKASASHTHSSATQAASGFMSTTDKVKLDDIELEANKFVLDEATDAVLGGVKIGTGIDVTTDGIISVANASSSDNGLMSSTDKAKLDAIDEEANKFVLAKPTASALGGVKIGDRISMDADGKISADDMNYTLQAAGNGTSGALGGVKIGNGILNNSGLISAKVVTAEGTDGGLNVTSDGLSIDKASTTAFGKVKVTQGNKLSISNGVISMGAPDAITSSDLPIATPENVGGIKVGTGLSIDGTGTLSATATGGGGTFDPPSETLEYSADTVVVGNGTTSVDFLVRDAAGTDLLYINADNKDIVAYSNAYLVAGNIPGTQAVKIEVSNGSTDTASYGCQYVMKHNNGTAASANSKVFSFDLQGQYNRLSLGWAVSGKSIIFDATDGHFAPSSTVATQDLGLSLWDDNGTAWEGFAWKNIYTVSGALNGSDERIKEQIADISEAERRVAVKAKGLLKKFKMKSAVKRKGDGARFHFGIIAQELIQAFTEEGLDAFDYSLIGKNEGYILDNPDGGTPIISKTDNGGRYSYMYVVRYHELLAFIISAL